MVVQTRVAHAQEVFIIGLPFDGVFGQGLLVIFYRQRFLRHIDMHFFSGQISLSIEQEVAKASIFRYGWWRGRREKTCHPGLVKQIGLVVDGALRHAGFRCSLPGCGPTQNHRSNDFVRPLCWIGEQGTKFLPAMGWLAALKSMFGYLSAPLQMHE